MLIPLEWGASFEMAFTLLFTTEMTIKVIALGFCAYIGDGWNQLDFTVVVMSWVPYVMPSLGNVSAIRSLRAIRPLKSISMMPGLKRQATTLIDSLPKLGDVILLFAFCLALYGVLGVQLFKGALRYRCYPVGSDPAIDAPIDDAAVCAVDGDDGLTSSACAPDGTEVCLEYGSNPNAGTMSFDDILSAMMIIFQCVTLEGWVDTMYACTRVTSPLLSDTYFISLVALGAFYVIQLFLAVLWDTYQEAGAGEGAGEGEGEGGEEAAPEAEGAAADEDGRDAAGAASITPPSKAGGGGGGGTVTDGAPLMQDYELLSDGTQVPRRRGGCCSCVNSEGAQRFVVCLIVLNTGAMCFEQYPMDLILEARLELLNVVLTIVFALEMLAKLCADGLTGYVSDAFNRFDGIVVLLSIFDLIITQLNIDLGVNTSVLRAFRLMRVFRLVRSWRNLRLVLAAMLTATGQLMDLLLLLLLLIFTYSLLGMALFGNVFTPSNGFDSVPRTNFDSTIHSMLTVFVVVSGENWNDVWTDTQAAVGSWCFGYFGSLVVAGNFVVLNLFVAILLGGFADLSAEKEDGAGEGAGEGEGAGAGAAAEEPPSQQQQQHKEPSVQEAIAGAALGAANGPGKGAGGADAGALTLTLDDPSDYVLGMLGPRNPIRLIATALVTFEVPGTPLSFDNVIVLLIVFSSAVMALDDCRVVPGSPLEDFVATAFYWTTMVFVAELVLKVLSLGLLSTPHAYLKSGWHQLDAAIVAASVASLVSTETSPALRAMRLLRVLRPLRLIARFGNLRIVVELFMRTLPSVGNVMLVVSLFCIVFGVLGVQLFAGRFASCIDANVAASSTRDECLARGGVWANPEMGSFDNIGQALLLLFESSTMEGWPDVMFAAIDAHAEQGHAPVTNFRLANALYVLLWVVVGGMFLLNVFIGVIVDCFCDIKLQEDGLKLMSEGQKQWVETMKHHVTLGPQRLAKEPNHSPQRACAYKAIKHPAFEPIVQAVILYNTLMMALDGYGISHEMAGFVATSNAYCTLIFLLEAACKIYALGFAEYARDLWNVFDFLVISTTVAAEAAEALVLSMSALPNPSLLRALRTVRILRLLRTVKAAKGLRTLFTTLLLALPALGNIMAIFAILLGLYSVLGMQLFGGVAHGAFLDANANFCSFGAALLTMLRSSTGESWNGIMHDLMVQPEMLTEDVAPRCSVAAGDCGSPFVAIAFFVSFTVLSGFILLNMMTALILEEYSKSLQRESHKISPDDAQTYVELWAKYDPRATGRIHVRHLQPLMRALPPPLGLNPKAYAFGVVREADVSAYISQLDNMQTYLNAETDAPEVSFFNLLEALTKKALADVADAAEVANLSGASLTVRNLQMMVRASQARLEGLQKPKNNLVELHSVCVIQRRWREAEPARKKLNAALKREAVRLRQPAALVPDGFAGRVGHSYVLWRGRMFIFGGRTSDKPLSDFWEYNMRAGLWLDQSHSVPPQMRARFGHSAALVGKTRMLVVGGCDGERMLSDVWECELSTLYWRQVGLSSDDKAARQLAAHAASRSKSVSPYGVDPAADVQPATRSPPTRLQTAAMRLRDEAATTLQAHARGRACRVELLWRIASADLDNDAAALIQAKWRGLRTRRAFVQSAMGMQLHGQGR